LATAQVTVTWQSYAWIAFAAVFAVVETVALIQKDRPGRPRTLSAQVWWLTQGTGPWHQIARAVLIFGLGWLTPHLLGGG
jgi:hypothetical protein